MKEQVSRKRRNWYQNEVDKETEGVDSRDKVKLQRQGSLLELQQLTGADHET